MQFDKNKLHSLILHTISNCAQDRLGAVKLHKVLYYSDMIRYANIGNSITGSTYRKRPFGPTCEQLQQALSEMTAKKIIEIKNVEYFGYLKKEYVSLVSEGESYLSKDEVELIDEVVGFVCNQNSARSISDLSHGKPWESVEFGEEIRYNSVYHMYPTEVSPEAMDWAAGQVHEIENTKSQSNPMGYVDFAAFRSKVLASRRA